MKTTKTKWLIWLQFASLSLFLFSEVNAKRPCGSGLLRNVKLPAHTKIALKQRKANHITVVCDEGYYFSTGENTRDLSCRILRRLSNIQIPQCKVCIPRSTVFKTLQCSPNKTYFLFPEVNAKRPCGSGLLRNVKLPAHTKIAAKQRKANHVTVACDEGYYFSKGENIRDLSCRILKLSNIQIPRCKGCGVPPGLRNGRVIFRATSVGSVAVYSCDVGFSLKGSRRHRICGRNLHWSGGKSHISCQKNKCRDPGNISIRNGNVTFSDKLFEEFTTMSFQCDKDYKLLGEEDIVCLQGAWSAKRLPFCRRKRCPKPDIPQNVRIFGSRFFIGSTVEFFCDSGFSLYGSRERTCQDDKTWNGTVAVCDDGNYSECGTSPFKPFDARARIVGGKITNERNWPWAVRILVGDTHMCGGTLINQEFVLTAAHCFKLEKIELHNVKVSLQDRNHSCLALYIHHDYNARNFRNDIALLKIPKLKYFTRNQQAICLPREINITNIIKDGNEMYAVGWGRTTPIKPNGFSSELHLSKDLKQVKLPFKANKFCLDNVKNKTAKELKGRKDIWYFNSTTQFCAGDITGQKDTCHGDGGGPAMVFHVHPVSGKWRWFQVGVVSWSHGCAQKGEVGYYTKVSAYVDWINQIAQLSSTNRRHALNLKNKGGMDLKDKRGLNLRYKGGLNLRYKGGLDLIFVLDTSSSVTRENLKIAKEFMKKIVQIFGVDERANGDGTHIACVTYGTRAQKEFTFNYASVQTLEKALKRIDKINYIGGGTATRLALDMVRKLILPSSKRPNSTKALFLVTDGGSNLGGSPKKAADYLKKQNVEIYVIGIGKKVQDKSLRRLASKDENVFAIRSYKDLNKVKKMIVTLPVKDYCECGTSPFKPFYGRARIVGGKITNELNWPWTVRILVGDRPVCGGTLINQEFVLTAAHCFDVDRTKPHDVKVLFQGKKLTVRRGLSLHFRSDFNRRNLRNDIALIKFPKLQRFTRNQQAICLPREVNTTKIIKDGNEMYAVGWGRTTPRKPKERSYGLDVSKNPLKQVKLPFIAKKFCEDNVKNKTAKALKKDKDIWYFNSTTQFCAGDITGQKDTCQGDSGGPAMVLNLHPVCGKQRWFQVGIVSWGYGCAQKGEVGYYTKVSAYVDWIDKIIKS